MKSLLNTNVFLYLISAAMATIVTKKATPKTMNALVCMVVVILVEGKMNVFDEAAGDDNAL